MSARHASGKWAATWAAMAPPTLWPKATNDSNPSCSRRWGKWVSASRWMNWHVLSPW
ncbi:hypothetical protein D3C72_2548850 [compost metagenome]